MTYDDDRALEIAALRYRILAEAAEADPGGVAWAIAEAACRRYLGIGGRELEVSERTLWRWLRAYRAGGLAALMPKRRSDAGQLRAFSTEVLERAAALRREAPDRPTKTVIDILERTRMVAPGELSRSTLDRHLDWLGLSRRQLHKLGDKTFRKILTTEVMELVIADFHHGPYVRVGQDEKARRALLLVFIDHFSRYLLDARYYLHEDFAALRFGFRRVLLCHGLFDKLYVDGGASFQARRFHAACTNELLGIKHVSSKPYAAEGRGVCERLNRTVKEQFEREVRYRDELCTLDELNAFFEAWRAERYHRDIHSETGEAPAERFGQHFVYRAAPDLADIDELLRLRQRSKVHKKWCTVEVRGVRYLVDSALRGRRVHSLYDPFDPSYVLIEFDGRIVERAYQQKAGVVPPQPDVPEPPEASVDYLQLLRDDYEARIQHELGALGMAQSAGPPELSQDELLAELALCRGRALSDKERSAALALRRKLRPMDAAASRSALQSVRRRLGNGLHLSLYLDDLKDHLVRHRAKAKGEKRR